MFVFLVSGLLGQPAQCVTWGRGEPVAEVGMWSGPVSCMDCEVIETGSSDRIYRQPVMLDKF